MREIDVQRPTVTFAQRRGWLAYKFASTSRRGVPDYLFIRNGVHLFIEFKAPGKEPTKLQDETHRRMRAHGARVFVVDNVRAGERLLQ